MIEDVDVQMCLSSIKSNSFMERIERAFRAMYLHVIRQRISFLNRHKIGTVLLFRREIPCDTMDTLKSIYRGRRK